MALNQLLLISILLITIFSFLLGFFSIFKNPKSFVVQLWFYTTMIIGLVDLSYYLSLVSETLNNAVFYSKSIYFFLSFLPPTFTYFVLSFTYQITTKKKLFIKCGYILGALFSFFILTSSEIVSGASPKLGFPFILETGRLHSLFLVYFLGGISIGMQYLIKGYRKSGGVMRRKIFWVLIANLTAFLGSITGYFPQTLGIFPYGYFIAWIYPILVTYGVFMDEFKIKIKF
jgi:hypothetical protein